MNQVFISYSHKDEEWKDLLQDQLAVLEMEGLLSVWEDRQIDLGDDWYPEIEKALNEADVAILLISAHFLSSKFIKSEEIPRLLQRREQEGIRVIPLILKPCPWRKVSWLSAMQGSTRDNVELSGLSEHKQDAYLSKLAERVHDLLEDTKPKPKPDSPTPTANIKIDRLPTVIGEFFGREAELKILNDAWGSNSTNILQFIAPGGTGKTKMIRFWLDQIRPEKLIAWSFYSQGSSEEKQPTATQFYSRVFELLDPSKTVTDFANQPEKMGEYLADLFRQQNCLLILDGFEPLQHSSPVLHGALKDRALRTLLKSLAVHHNSLCIITTRIAIHELSGHSKPVVISYNLQNLAEQDGVSLLKYLGIKGSDSQLRKAVNEYGRHALALHLLGNALTAYYEGDILRRDKLDDLISEYDEVSQHAFKVMKAYQKWLNNTPELQLLYLLGLFDHPIEAEVLEVLWKAQIPNLTVKIPHKAWQTAIRNLREKHRLLSTHEDRPELLDCHPLIREYFGKQLKDNQSVAWKQAHKKLYEYYKAIPKTYPDTLDEMQPLFNAITHGCAAGLHQRAMTEVYFSRIERKEEFFNVMKLGAFSDDLAAIACFFDVVWQKPSAKLKDSWQLRLLGFAGFCLKALGRLREALAPTKAHVEKAVQQQNWKEAALATKNLSELQLALGGVAQAKISSQRSVTYADKSGLGIWRTGARTTDADAFHHAGEASIALNKFREAEQVFYENEPENLLLDAKPGYCYCDLLFTQGSLSKAMSRAEKIIKQMQMRDDLFGIALNQLILGRGHLKLGDLTKATLMIDHAVAGLRAAGTQDHLPLGLLARSSLHCHTKDFERAAWDLQEVFEISEPSGMRLHLTDYHLEMGRLVFAENHHLRFIGKREMEKLHHHVCEAERLIKETGYHRREGEFKELQKNYNKTQQP